MKNTSIVSARVHADITFIQSALSKLTLSELLQMSASDIRYLATLLETVDSNDVFATTFPKMEVLDYQKNVHTIATSKRTEIFKNNEQYADWCSDKLREKIEHCKVKLVQMLEGAAFRNEIVLFLDNGNTANLSEEQFSACNVLYLAAKDVQTRSLLEYHRAHMRAKAHM